MSFLFDLVQRIEEDPHSVGDFLFHYDIKIASSIENAKCLERQKKGIQTITMEGEHVERLGSLHDLVFVVLLA